MAVLASHTACGRCMPLLLSHACAACRCSCRPQGADTHVRCMLLSLPPPKGLPRSCSVLLSLPPPKGLPHARAACCCSTCPP